MSNQTTSTSGAGMGLGGLLFLVFVVLQLTGHIDWPWYAITAPLWVPLAVALMIFIPCVIIAALAREPKKK